MNIVDLLVTIVVVTILVTIVLAVITYVAYKLRLSREPQREIDDGGPQYFVRFAPPGAEGVPAFTDGPAGVSGTSDVEEHAAEA